MDAPEKYSIIRKIADGGMAEIFLARLEGTRGFRQQVRGTALPARNVEDAGAGGQLEDLDQSGDFTPVALEREQRFVFLEILGVEIGRPPVGRFARRHARNLHGRQGVSVGLTAAQADSCRSAVRAGLKLTLPPFRSGKLAGSPTGLFFVMLA